MLLYVVFSVSVLLLYVFSFTFADRCWRGSFLVQLHFSTSTRVDARGDWHPRGFIFILRVGILCTEIVLKFYFLQWLIFYCFSQNGTTYILPSDMSLGKIQSWFRFNLKLLTLRFKYWSLQSIFFEKWYIIYFHYHIQMNNLYQNDETHFNFLGVFINFGGCTLPLRLQ